MTDRELLEKAAKAAGIEGEHRTENLCVGGDWMDVTAIFLADDMGWWNPLEDDGNALRLAAALNIWPVRQYDRPTIVVQKGAAYFDELASEPIGDDVCAAVRRAIVRAAAEMADAAGAAQRSS